MLTSFWSVKGGVGVSTIASMAALARAGRAEPTLLVDLAGDLPALLGLEEPAGPGISEWCATPSRDGAALSRITVAVGVDLAVLPRGAPAFHGAASPPPQASRGSGADRPAGAHEDLIAALRASERCVVIDCGLGADPMQRAVVAASDRRLLVLRPCYLALRAARSVEPAPTGVVLVTERGRALGVGDAESVTGAPVVATVACDPAVARVIDAGLTTSRLPRGLLRALVPLTADA